MAEKYQRRVLQVKKSKFKKECSNPHAIWILLALKGFDIHRHIGCMKDPEDEDRIYFWQSLPNEFILKTPDGPIA